MEIQLVPIMQVYITVDVTHKQNLLGVLNACFTDNKGFTYCFLKKYLDAWMFICM